MTMLTHTRGRFDPAPYSSQTRNAAGARQAKARLAMVKRLFLCTLVALLAGGAVAAIMTIKVASFFWRFHYS